VYHEGWMKEEEKSQIKFHRHAEVIVPEELGLDALQRVWCRSEAEYQTLLHFLTPEQIGKYKGIIDVVVVAFEREGTNELAAYLVSDEELQIIKLKNFLSSSLWSEQSD